MFGILIDRQNPRDSLSTTVHRHDFNISIGYQIYAKTTTQRWPWGWQPRAPFFKGHQNY